MQKIKQLPLSEIQKIAAGQVVERPSNVVKELVENSLDAGSTKISVYIEAGGERLIRVVDNGTGMSEVDAALSFERHATSKITNFLPLIAETKQVSIDLQEIYNQLVPHFQKIDAKKLLPR
jgi:DNA mismatch repair protein MutL